MKIEFIFFTCLFLIGSNWTYAQEDVEFTEPAVYLDFDKDEIPSSKRLKQVDTIREGLYRASVGSDFGYDTGEYKQGIYNDEQALIPFWYYRIWGDYDENFMLAVKDRKYGAIDTLNTIIIPFEYRYLGRQDDKLTYAANKYFKATKAKRIGLLDREGNEVIPIVYASLEEVVPDIFIVKNEQGEFGLVNLKLGLFTKCTHGAIGRPIMPGYLKSNTRELIDNRVHRKFGCINLQGQQIVPEEYEKVEASFDQQYILALNGVGTDVYDKQGKLVFQTKEAALKNLVKGRYYTLGKDRLYHLFKDNFKEEPLGQDYSLGLLSENLYLKNREVKDVFNFNIKNKSKISILDNKGQAIIEDAFFKVKYLNDRLIFTKQNQTALYGIIDAKGTSLQEAKYASVKVFPKYQMAVVGKIGSDKLALMDSTGRALTPFLYDWINIKSRGQKVVIEGVKGDSIYELDESGNAYDLQRENIFNAIRNIPGKRKKANESFAGKSFYKLIQINEKKYLAQYLFDANNMGQRIIYFEGKHGEAYIFRQGFNKQVVDVIDYNKDEAWMNLSFEAIEKSATLSAKLWKVLENQLLRNERYTIKMNYNFSEIEIDGLSHSNKDKDLLPIQQILELQEELQANLYRTNTNTPYQPRVYINPQTGACFLKGIANKEQQFSKLYFKNEQWYLGLGGSYFSEHGKGFDFGFKNVNYMDANGAIQQGAVRLFSYNLKYALRLDIEK